MPRHSMAYISKTRPTVSCKYFSMATSWVALSINIKISDFNAVKVAKHWHMWQGEVVAISDCLVDYVVRGRGGGRSTTHFCLYNIYLSSRWTPVPQLGTCSQTSLDMITYVHLNQIRLFILNSLLVVFSTQLHIWSTQNPRKNCVCPGLNEMSSRGVSCC